MRENFFNLEEFHTSTTKELDSLKDRVRNLIGDSNWAEEGRYKEAILRNMIKKFISPKYTVGTGFIINSFNKEIENSTQIDVLIFDSDYPTLFSEGDFYIVTPNSVKAVIEVKTELKIGKLEESVEKLNKIGYFLKGISTNINPFIGIFSFDGNYRTDKLEERIKLRIQNGIGHKCYINHLSLNKDIFIKFWEDRWQNKGYFSVYELENLSFSYFISNLIYSITDQYIQNEQEMWFPNPKEDYKLFDIDI